MTTQISNPEQLLGDVAWLRRLSHTLALDPDEGEEIYNTTLVAAWERSQQARAPRAWLAGVARNKATRLRRDAVRRRQRECRAARDEAQPAAAEIVERVELQGRVVEAVLGLGEPYTSTLLLRYWDDLQPGEVAESLDVGIETVRTRLKRGLSKLRGQLDQSFGGRAAWLVPLATWAGIEPRAVLASTGVGVAVPWVVGLVAVSVLCMTGLAAVVNWSDPAPLAEPMTMAGEREGADPDRAPVQEQTSGFAPAAEAASTRQELRATGVAAGTRQLDQAGAIQILDSMQQILAAQQRCRQTAHVDDDADGSGEFGYFAELRGPGRPAVASPSVRPRARWLLRVPMRFAAGIATIGSYHFQIYLPGTSGRPIAEAEAGGVSVPAPDPDLAELFWCCYAWPVARQDGVAGPVFFVDQDGKVLVSDNQRRGYAGRAHRPQPRAAFALGSSGRLGDPKPSGAAGEGLDGQVWLQAILREDSVQFKLVDAQGRPLQGARLTVRSEVPPGRPAARARVRRQLQAIRKLGGLKLPLHVRGVSDAAGLVTLRGPLASGVYLMLVAAGEAAGRIPTALTRDGEWILVEMPPVAVGARIEANERSAIATLKNISSSQAQCWASGAIDANANGAGEYGYFAELSGSKLLRGSSDRLSPPVLSGAFGKFVERGRPDLAGVVQRAGYYFAIYLPDERCQGLAEAATGGVGGVAPDPVRAEVIWCCYAWPVVWGKSGRRAFFVNQSGDVMACRNENRIYGGLHIAPRFDAASDPAARDPGMSAGVAMNKAGRDGETWVVVN